jgi:ABC-2 type transport system ATP-binding protein
MTAPTLATRTTVDVALRCRGLRRRYRDLVAVDDLSFEIALGETYGLLGPNGAGKTTVISMVAGILSADAGEVYVAGQPMTTLSTAVKTQVGYVPQEVALYPDLSGRENLRFFCRLYGLGRAEGRSRTDEVLETIGLAQRGRDLVREYSGGMKRRLNIGVGLLHRPRLLILDEPTVGVDPQSRNAILGSVETLAAAGMAVLYTTHYMEEAQHLCDRVGIIDVGRLVAEGTPRELTTMVGQHDRVVLVADGDLATAASELRAVDGIREVSTSAGGIQLLATDARAALPVILKVAGAAGAGVRSVAVQEPDLEAVFLHLTGKSLRD